MRLGSVLNMRQGSAGQSPEPGTNGQWRRKEKRGMSVSEPGRARSRKAGVAPNRMGLKVPGFLNPLGRIVFPSRTRHDTNPAPNGDWIRYLQGIPGNPEWIQISCRFRIWGLPGKFRGYSFPISIIMRLNINNFSKKFLFFP